MKNFFLYPIEDSSQKRNNQFPDRSLKSMYTHTHTKKVSNKINNMVVRYAYFIHKMRQYKFYSNRE